VTNSESSELHFEHVERTLPNGLRLCAVNLPHVHRAVLHAQLAAGSRFETESDNGISHFLEHMLYRGTPSHPSAHELAWAFERQGGSLDATTACDTGTLSLSAPPDQLPGLVGAFAEVFQRPRFDGIDIERGIVREEILETLDDDGKTIDADELIRALMFDGHGLGRPITGTLDHLETFTLSRLCQHHEALYCAANGVIVAAGRIDAGAMLDELQRHFEALPTGRPLTSSPPPHYGGQTCSYVRNAGSQTDLRLAFRAPGQDDPDQAAMEVLARLLDDGMSSRLYHRICDQLGLCYDVSAGYETYSDSGLVELRAETSHERAADVLSELVGIVVDLREQGPDVDELRATHNRFRWQAQSLLDEPEALAEYVAETLRRGKSPSLQQRCATIGAVTADDVRRAAQRWWTAGFAGLVAVGNLSKRERSALDQMLDEL